MCRQVKFVNHHCHQIYMYLSCLWAHRLQQRLGAYISNDISHSYRIHCHFITYHGWECRANLDLSLLCNNVTATSLMNPGLNPWKNTKLCTEILIYTDFLIVDTFCLSQFYWFIDISYIVTNQCCLSKSCRFVGKRQWRPCPVGLPQ